VQDFAAVVAALLESYGPWALFGLAILETCFITGLVVPSGTAAAFAAAVSADGPEEWVLLASAIAAGGWIGDWVGYGIGRAAGPGLVEGEGWVGRLFRRHQEAAGRFLGRQPFYSVTVARLVSFVRTLMPMSAGMSGVHPGTFFVYELPGVLLWAGLYVGIGALAGESWQIVSSLVGLGWLVLFGVVGLVLWLRARRGRGASS
jgi:membrane protein DedA with SNARE-associated domain